MRIYLLTRLSWFLTLVALLVSATPVAAQEQVVTPTYTREGMCYQTVPCQIPCPPPTTVTALPCTPAPSTPPPVIRYRMRSKPLFWSGVAMVGAGITFTIASMTWQQQSEVVSYPSAPCGTDPYLTRLPIAPCETNRPLLSAGVAIVSAGATLMWHGGRQVAIGSDGRQITVHVKF